MEAMVRRARAYGAPMPEKGARFVISEQDEPAVPGYVISKPGETPIRIRTGLLTNEIAAGTPAVNLVDDFDEKRLSSDKLIEMLLTSVQMHEAGLTGLATRYLRKELPGYGDLATFDLQAEMADLMVEYWFRALQEPECDRRFALAGLESSLKERPDFQPEVLLKMIGDLKETLRPPGPARSEIELAIDALVEMRSMNAIRTRTGNEEIRKLLGYGLRAVPDLIRHVNDRRLTRSWSQGPRNDPGHHRRVGEVASLLLYEYSARTLDTSRLSDLDDWEVVSPEDARTWFASTRNSKEEDVLVAACPEEQDSPWFHDDSRCDDLVIYTLGRRCPKKLFAVYEAELCSPTELFDIWTAAVVSADATLEERTATLHRARLVPSSAARTGALAGLLELKAHPEFLEVLELTLDSIPTSQDYAPGMYAWYYLAVHAGASHLPKAHDLVREAAKKRSPEVRTQLLMFLVDEDNPEELKQAHCRFLAGHLDDEGVLGDARKVTFPTVGIAMTWTAARLLDLEDVRGQFKARTIEDWEKLRVRVREAITALADEK